MTLDRMTFTQVQMVAINKSTTNQCKITRTIYKITQLKTSDGQMELHDASFALLGHLVDAKISVGINLKCVVFCRKEIKLSAK